MKALTTLALTALISFNAFSADYACQEPYQKFEDNLLKKEDRFIGGYTGSVLGVWAVEGLFLKTTIVAGSTIITTPIASGIFLAGLGWMLIEDTSMRAKLAAKAIIEEAINGNETILNVMEEKNNAYYISWEELRLKEINKDRSRQNLPHLTMEEHLISHPLPVFDRANAPTELRLLTERMNKKGENVTYDQVATMVKSLSGDQTFCPNGKIMGRRQIQNLVSKKIN